MQEKTCDMKLFNKKEAVLESFLSTITLPDKDFVHGCKFWEMFRAAF